MNQKLLYHHCIDLEYIIFGEISRNEKQVEEPDFLNAYKWLEREVGFFPIFLAVGATLEDIRMTGYQNNWRKILSEGPSVKEYSKKDEIRNSILFSFENVEGIFMDYDMWHIVFNSDYKDYQITSYERKLIFKPSWTKTKWLKFTRRKGYVQLIAPKLDLTTAKRICVRNQQTKKALESMGFENVKVKRILLNDY